MISKADAHERQANNRARARNTIEQRKVIATREQTAELRLLRETLERLLSILAGTPSEDTE